MNGSTVCDGLRDLYLELGGDASAIKECRTVTDYIRALNTVLGGGGSTLPVVSAEDNGQVLTVVNGQWDKATPSSGPEKFDVTYYHETSGGAEEFDRTSAEILAALEAGKEIRFQIGKDTYLNGSKYNTLDDLVMTPTHYDLGDDVVTQLGFSSCFKGAADTYYALAFNLDLTDTDPVLTVINLTPST